MVQNLDTLDRNILYELDVNSRQSFSQIAKKLKMGRERVAYRVHELEKRGIIREFVTVTSMTRLGCTVYKLYMDLKGISIEKENELLHFLYTHPSVIWIVSAEGMYNLLIGVYAKNIYGLEVFKSELLEKYGRYISTRHTFIGITIEILNRKYLKSKPAIHLTESNMAGEYTTEKIDELDTKLLASLAQDSRIKVTDLSQKLHLTPKTVISRIKLLEKKSIIKRYRITMDITKIGLYFFKLCIYTYSLPKKRFRDLLEYARNNPYVVYLIQQVGPWELELEAEVPNVEEFYKIKHDLLEKFPDIIEKTEIIHITKEYKLRYLPRF